MLQCNLGVIGAGNMANAIIEGILKKEVLSASDIHVYDIDSSKLSAIANKTGIIPAKNNIDLVKNCKVFIIAVKPHIYDKVLEEIVDYISHDHLLISIAAGISTDYIKAKTSNRCKVVRVMPNTPVLVGEGMSVVCITHEIDNNQRGIVNKIKDYINFFLNSCFYYESWTPFRQGQIKAYSFTAISNSTARTKNSESAIPSDSQFTI